MACNTDNYEFFFTLYDGKQTRAFLDGKKRSIHIDNSQPHLFFNSISLRQNITGMFIDLFDDKNKLIDIYGIDSIEHFESLKAYAKKYNFLQE
ncbi:hypothetical protein [Photobacterium damselae]|uniref:hypothetical protein n=1 Tax=Photobacterium damselae TaxID=38293 RepID=UPI004068F143